MTLRWTVLVGVSFVGLVVVVSWLVLMCIDGVWVWQDARMGARCDAAYAADTAPIPGELAYPKLVRVCASRGLIPEYHVMRNTCFDWFLRDGSYCHDEWLRISNARPTTDMCTLDIPCGQKAWKFCSAAFPVTLWR